MKSNKLAIITARGGSKRIPKKNIKYFLGMPIIAYSIKSAIESGLFDEVMVSTDDNEIAEIATYYGAKVPFMRSSLNSNDYATTVDVLIEVLNCYRALNKYYDFCCCIYPTAPFVTPEKLKNGFESMINHGYDSVFPVVPFSYPIQRALHLFDGRLSMIEPKNINTRSQDLVTTYHDVGQFYWFRSQTLLESKTLIGNNAGALIVNELEMQDIDSMVDWKLAELKYSILHSEL